VDPQDEEKMSTPGKNLAGRPLLHNQGLGVRISKPAEFIVARIAKGDLE
jgi:hypothetical protein